MYLKDSVLIVTVIIEKDEDAFHVHSPDLKGLHICAETKEEALDAAAHGTIAYLETMLDEGLPIPPTVVCHSTLVSQKTLHAPCSLWIFCICKSAT